MYGRVNFDILDHRGQHPAKRVGSEGQLGVSSVEETTNGTYEEKQLTNVHTFHRICVSLLLGYIHGKLIYPY